MPTVRLLSGGTVPIDEDGLLFVCQLRELAAEKLSVPKARLRLALGVEVLDDARLLSELPASTVINAMVVAPLSSLTCHSDGRLRMWDAASSKGGETALRFARAGHGGGILSMHVDWVQLRAVTGSADWTLRIWDLATERPTTKGVLMGHEGAVNAVHADFAGAAPWAVSGSEDGTVRIWDVNQMACTATLQAPGGQPVFSVAAGGAARWALSGGRDTILRVWDCDTGAQVGQLEGHGSWINALYLDTSAQMALSGSADWTLRTWDLRELMYDGVFMGHEGPVSVVRADFARGLAASGSVDATMRVWSLHDGTCTFVFGCDSPVRSLDANFGGQRALSGHADGTLSVWDLEEGQCLHSMRSEGGAVLGASLDGQY